MNFPLGDGFLYFEERVLLSNQIFEVDDETDALDLCGRLDIGGEVVEVVSRVGLFCYDLCGFRLCFIHALCGRI